MDWLTLLSQVIDAVTGRPLCLQEPLLDKALQELLRAAPRHADCVGNCGRACGPIGHQVCVNRFFVFIREQLANCL